MGKGSVLSMVRVGAGCADEGADCGVTCPPIMACGHGMPPWRWRRPWPGRPPGPSGGC